jgi:DNA-binding IscR family transcriptional regulator
VIEAAEGRTFVVNCDLHRVSSVRCGPDSECSIRPVWRELQRRVDGLLSSISLADMLRHEAEVEELVST